MSKKATKPTKVRTTAKSQLKRLCVQDPLKMAKVIQRLEKEKNFYKENFWNLYPWKACHKCHMKFGAEVPNGVTCSTVTIGLCTICYEDGQTLVPTADYIWRGRTYIWD